MKLDVPVIKMAVKADASAKTAEINIEGEIGWYEWDGEKYVSNTAPAIRRQLAELMDMDVAEITVNIHSLGGYVDDALAIHDALALHPAKVTTRVTGFTASAATVIAQAGDERLISENAMYLVHEAWGFAMGTEADFRDYLEMLETLNGHMARLYAKRAGGKEQDYRSIMAEKRGVGKWITADKAVELGFADRAFEPMKAAAAVVQYDMARIFLPKQVQQIEAPTNDIVEGAQESGAPIQYNQQRNREAEILTLTYR
jgi:ATP-dependent Clp protease, protease subunit